MLALTFPACAFAHRETVTGTLVELHGHRADGTEVQRSYAIRSATGELPLADAQPEALLGQQVRIADAQPAPGLQGEVRPAGSQRATRAVAPGPRSLLVILVTTPDQPIAAATPEEARAAVFTGPASANALYQQQSGGATSFVGLQRPDGDVAGPLDIGVSTAGCRTLPLANAADGNARAAGWAVDAYDHVLYVLPHTSECDWGGQGELPGRRVWSNGFLDTQVIAHELGHNLGAHHANAYRCAAGGAPVTLSASCTSTEYGDPFDVMATVPRLMSSWHRAQLGELPAGQELRLRASQTVDLVSSDDFASAGPRLLLVPRKDPGEPVSSWLAVELRSALGPFDAWSLGSPVTTGVSIRLVPDVAVATQSQLLDASPDTASFDDAPLQVGATVRDDAHAIAIRLDAIAGTTAAVTVTMPALVDDLAPTPPAGVQVTGNTNVVALRWGAAADDEAIADYQVERDGVVVGTTPGLSFDDTGVAALVTASYRVIAVDTSGNRRASDAVGVALPDATPPGPVPGLALTVRGGDVTVRWSAAADNRLIRAYRVARDGAVLHDIGGLSFGERPPAGRHAYAVAAVDAAGNVGPQATVVMPGAASGPALARPRIRLVRRSRRDGIVTMTFAADGASAMSAYRGATRVRRVASARLTVRLRVPRRVARPIVRVVASSRAGTSSRRFVLR
jgi:hypothetical protein